MVAVLGRRALVAVVVLGVCAVGCGGDDSEDSSPRPATEFCDALDEIHELKREGNAVTEPYFEAERAGAAGEELEQLWMEMTDNMSAILEQSREAWSRFESAAPSNVQSDVRTQADGNLDFLQLAAESGSLDDYTSGLDTVEIDLEAASASSEVIDEVTRTVCGTPYVLP